MAIFNAWAELKWPQSHALVMVLPDENLDVMEIWEGDHEAVLQELQRQGSVARNDRGALSVGTIKQKRPDLALRWHKM